MKINPYESPSSPTAGNRSPASRFEVPLWWYTAIGWAQLAVVASAAASIFYDGGVTLLVQYVYLLGPLLTSAIVSLSLAADRLVRLINVLFDLISLTVWLHWLFPILQHPWLPGNPTCLAFGLFAVGLAIAGALVSLEAQDLKNGDSRRTDAPG